MEQTLPGRVRFGAFELDTRAGELHRNGDSVILQEQQFTVLLMLIERRGEIATREEIKKRLWPNDTVVEFDHGINNTIKNLRRMLDDSAQNPQYIETVARRGYRLMVPVEWESGAAAADSGEESSAVSGEGAVSDSESGELPKAKLKVGRLTGKVVSHYRVLEVIGGGGMGLVYRAEDLKLGRAVALKFLPEEVGEEPKVRERFEREAKAVSALNHANICTVHDFDEYEGHPFIAMELLQGKTLRDHIVHGGFRLNEPQGMELAIQIASGLEAAHEKGIIHRDIKPANIFITEKNVAKILDFGVAKVLEVGAATAASGPDRSGNQSPSGLIPVAQDQDANPQGTDGAPKGAALQEQMETSLTRTGMKLGTAGYMSPEQVRGEPLDARTDIFSFGLVLYEMATGGRAFTGNTVVAINDAILHQMPSAVREANPKASVKLETIVAKCLEKDRGQRYQHASELRAELQRLTPRARVSRWLWAAAVALLIVSALGIWIASRRPKPAPEPKLTQLTSNFNENPIRSGALSPDNKYLAYADLEGVHLQDLKTGETRSLNSPSADDRIIRFSDIFWWPDGSAIIGNDVPPPERETEGVHSRVWLVPLSGDAPHVLREDGEVSAVSPDGKSVLFQTNRGAFGYREVWQMDSTGGREQLLLKADKDSSALGAVWLGGGRLAYVAVDKLGVTVESRKLTGGPPTVALTFHDQAHTSRLQAVLILNDGLTFYVVAEPGSNNLYCTLWGTRIDRETGKLAEEPRKLGSRTRSCMGLMSASSDGRRILLLEWSGEESIYVADLIPKSASIRNPRRITPSEAYYLTAWTANSKEVVYKASHNGQTGIFRQSIVAGSAIPIVVSLARPLGTHHGLENLNATRPRLTPDGRFVLYTIYDETQSDAARQKILRVPLEGGESEFVLSAKLYGVPDCARALHGLCVFSERSDDRKQITFTSFDPMSGRGGEIATFSANPKADYRWVISPESDRIALVNDQNPSIDLVYLDGRPAQKVMVNGQRNFDWVFLAPDGKGFYVSTLGQYGSQLLYVDLHGAARIVWEERGGLGTYGIPSPDGRHIAMKGWTLATNLWMMENF